MRSARPPAWRLRQLGAAPEFAASRATCTPYQYSQPLLIAANFLVGEICHHILKAVPTSRPVGSTAHLGIRAPSSPAGRTTERKRVRPAPHKLDPDQLSGTVYRSTKARLGDISGISRCYFARQTAHIKQRRPQAQCQKSEGNWLSSVRVAAAIPYSLWDVFGSRHFSHNVFILTGEGD